MVESKDNNSGSLTALITYTDEMGKCFNFQEEIRRKLFKNDTARDEPYRLVQKTFSRYSHENRLWEPFLDFSYLKEEGIQEEKFSQLIAEYKHFKTESIVRDSEAMEARKGITCKQEANKSRDKYYTELLEDDYLMKNFDFEKTNLNDCKFYNNYSFIPNCHSQKPIPLVYCSCESLIDNSVYVFGGLKYDASIETSSELKIRNLSQKQYPYPLDDSILTNIHIVHNNDMFLLNADTGVLEKINIVGERPPPLCSCTTTKISKRYIFYYGGFCLEDQIVTDETINEKVRDRKVIPYNQCWIFDAYLKRFKELNLMTHPTYTTLYPLTVPRFGHSTAANIVNEENVETTDDKYSRYYDNEIYDPKKRTEFRNSRSSSKKKNIIHSNDFVSLFIFGGFTWDEAAKEFKTLGDLWKVDLIIADRGSNDYLQFGNDVLAVPLIKENTGPTPRGYHVSALIDKTNEDQQPVDVNKEELEKGGIFNKKVENQRHKNNQKVFDCDKESLTNKVLLIHGGHNEKNKIFGFIWKYDFQRNEWSILKTYHKRRKEKTFLKFDSSQQQFGKPFEVQHRRTCHAIKLLEGRNLVFYSGKTSIIFDNFVCNSNDHDEEMQNNFFSEKYLRETKDLFDEDESSIKVLDIDTNFWNLDHYTVLEHYNSLDLNIEIMERLKEKRNNKTASFVDNQKLLNSKLLEILRKDLTSKAVGLFKFLRDFEQTFDIDLQLKKNRMILVKLIYLREYNLEYYSRNIGSIGSGAAYSGRSLYIIGGVFNNIFKDSMFAGIISDNIDIFLSNIVCLKVPSFSKGV